eukprot:756695-Hanusia_phi.AAC.1
MPNRGIGDVGCATMRARREDERRRGKTREDEGRRGRGGRGEVRIDEEDDFEVRRWEGGYASFA